MKNEDFRKQIEALIEKELPNQVGEALRKKLEQADKDAVEVARLRGELDYQIDVVNKLKEQLEEHRVLGEREIELEKREEKVEERERNIDLTLLTTRLAEAEKRADTVTEFTMGLVRNTTFRKNIYDNEDQAGYQDGNGNWIQPGPVNKHLEETQTEE